MELTPDIVDKYEAVIGLEVHAQLLTHSKAFSAERNEYGNLPNTNTGPISLGHPGTLPVLNEKSVEFAVRLGLACGANIREENQFARKNYFYADLPKGYQITQDTTPICTGGTISIKVNDTVKRVGLTRIHMEEDSGKSIHDLSPFETMIDLNRAGVPLLEIVSDPDMRTGDEAYAYLTEVRKLLRYLEICDGNMEEGSMRCDANVSVRLRGSSTFGTRVEIKNLNSIRNVKRAIEFEIDRHIRMNEAGEPIQKSTLTFNAATGETSIMRTKEEADDYRYFPEPDLLPYYVSERYIEAIQANLPPLPADLYEKYTKKLGLSSYDANVLTEEKFFALYFESLLAHTKDVKSAANWMMGEVKGYLNERAIDIKQFPIPAKQLAEVINMVIDGQMGRTLASQQLFPLLLENPSASPKELATMHGLVQVNDLSELEAWVDEVIAAYPEKVNEYKAGKKGILGLFMGEVMRKSKGKADPKKTSTIIQNKLED